MRSRLAVGAAFGVLAVCVFAAAHPALAQLDTTQLAASAAAAGASTASLPIIIARVIRVFLGTLGIIFTCVVLYAGWIYMTAQGDDTKLKQAKNMIKNGVIGMILCIFSFTITTFILNSFLGALMGGSGSSSIAANYSEPLSGSLGAGIIESHYPERDAIEIPRNTRIMVTFKEGIDPASIFGNWNADPAVLLSAQSPDLSANVGISCTQDDTEARDERTGSDVRASTVNDGDDKNGNPVYKTFVFAPVAYLGSATNDQNCKVTLSNTIKKANGTSAFSGVNSEGYEWNFEVSTVVDLTPPQIVSMVPNASSADSFARNITLSMTFSEAMDPVAGTGAYGGTGTFDNITVDSMATGARVPGRYAISNGYKTIEFTPTEECGKDPCGDTIYCLPAGNPTDTVTVTAKAASVSSSDSAQADPVFVPSNGLVDAAANSLDGNKDTFGKGPPEDTQVWTNLINNTINDTVPTIAVVSPDIMQEESDPDAPVAVQFSALMKSSTLSTTNLSLWPDPYYEFWFTTGNTDLPPASDTVDSSYTTASISHPSLVRTEDGGWGYDPVVLRDVKSAYQICMYPADGPKANADGIGSASPVESCGTDSSVNRYCCNGVASPVACSTYDGTVELPDSNPQSTN